MLLQFFVGTHCDSDDPSSWPGEYKPPGSEEVDTFGHEILDPPLYALPEIQAVLDQLVGAGNHANGLRPVNPFLGETEEPYHKETDNFIVKFPGEKPWVAPSGGHIEGYNGTKGGWFGGCPSPLPSPAAVWP